MPEINCIIPIKLRISGRVDDELLDRLERQLVPLIAARLALAERTVTVREGGATREIVREEFAPDSYDATGGSYQIPSFQGQGQRVAMPTKPASAKVAEATPQPIVPTLQRIHELLHTGRVFHRHASPSQAHEVLRLLQGLAPKLLFEAVRAMRVSGDWNTLLRDSPPADEGALIELQESIDPAVGYIMPGDVLVIGLSAWGQPEREYRVDADGVVLPYLHAPIVGLRPQAAAQRIADAYVEAQGLREIVVTLGVRRRGSFYAGVSAPGQSQGPFDRPIMFTGAVRIDPVERRRRDKQHELLSFLLIRRTDYTLENLYHKARSRAEKEAIEQQIEEKDATASAFETWIEQNYASPEFLTSTPEALWEWARQHAPAPAPKTPLQQFLDFELERLGELKGVPEAERATYQEAIDRYDDWLQKHRDDPGLGGFAPPEVWAQAYLQAVRHEVRETIARNKEEVARRARDKPIDMAAVNKKLDDWELLLRSPDLALTRTDYVEEPSEGVGVLIMPSEEEVLVRNEIVQSFSLELLRRVAEPDFPRTSAKEDFDTWLFEHQELRDRWERAKNNPTVERNSLPTGIPAWQTVIDVGISFIPVVGQIVTAGEAIIGRDIFLNKLSPTDRAIAAASVLLPAAGKLFGAGREAVAASRITDELKDLGLTERQAGAVYRATAPIAPGTQGRQLLTEAADEVRALKPVRDPARLQKLDALFHEQGLTDRATLDALSSSEAGAARAEAPTTPESPTVEKTPGGEVPSQGRPPAAPPSAAEQAADRLQRAGHRNLLDDVAKEFAGHPELRRTYLERLNALTDRQLDGLSAIQRADRATGGLGRHTWYDVLDLPPGFRDDLLGLVGDVHDVTRSGLAEAVARGLRANPNDIQGALGHFYAARTLRARFPDATMAFEVDAGGREVDIVLDRGGRHIDVEVKTNLSGDPSIKESQIRKDLLRHMDDRWNDLLYLYAPQKAGELGSVQRAILRMLQDPEVKAALARRGMSVADAERILTARFASPDPLVDTFTY